MMAERIFPNPNRFEQLDSDCEKLDREIKYLRYIKFLVPTDEDLAKYGPKNNALNQIEGDKEVKLAIIGIVTILRKQAEIGKDYVSTAHIFDAIDRLLPTESREHLPTYALSRLVDKGYVIIKDSWGLRLIKQLD